MRGVRLWNNFEHELLRPGIGDDFIEQIRIIQTRAIGYLNTCCVLNGVGRLYDPLNESFVHHPSRQSAKSKTPPVSSPVSCVSSSPSHIYDTKHTRHQEQSPSITVSHKSVINDVDSSLAKPREPHSELRLYPQVTPPDDVIERWNEILMPQINLALKKFYRRNPESVEISLECIGESAEKATPTALVICTSVSKVRAILDKKLGVLFDGTTANFSLKVCRGSVVRSRKVPSESTDTRDGHDTSSQHSGTDTHETEIPAANPGYQEKPRNGASIGAWIGDKHLSPVSLGGVIIVDDKPYGMTVHHMLDDPDYPFQAPKEDEGISVSATSSTPTTFRSTAAGQEVLYLTDGEILSDSSDEFACEFSDTESEFSVMEFTGDGQGEVEVEIEDAVEDVVEDVVEDEDDDEDKEFGEPGDIPGIEPGCGYGYIVTQPAFDDVPADFYPSPETEDEDHIDTYKLGEVYASSGIRRRTENQMIHEIDWALFEFHDDRLPDTNLFPLTTVQGNPTTASGLLQPVEVVPAKSLPGLDVLCMARTSGSQTGRILPALTSVKLHGRASPSHSYQVSGRVPSLPNQTRGRQGALGIPGDSGAWIVDRLHGRLCGHILAWSERKQVAYICPMEVLLRDIAETLQASDVRLPNGQPIVSLAQNISDDGIVEISRVNAWSGGDPRDTKDVPQLSQARDSVANIPPKRLSSPRAGPSSSNMDYDTHPEGLG